MSHSRILIVFASSYGQTAKIAGRLRETLVGVGCDVFLENAAEPMAALPLETFDGIVVGASVIARGHQPVIDRFVRAHRDRLNRMPSAFFSVSASAGSSRAEGRAAASRMLEKFLTSTDWQPRLSASIAGAINYTKYNPLLRWYMKRASRKNGGSTDTSHDHEYTDWAQVERFAADVAEMIHADVASSRASVG
jgi:menaquinone-dependent protoporphyrinogen oxidase